MCGQPTAYNTYATMPTTNPLFMGFSGYQNVNFGPQRDNQFHNAERLTAFQKVYYTPGLLFWSVFIAKQEYKYD